MSNGKAISGGILMAAKPKLRVSKTCYRYKLPNGSWQIRWTHPDTHTPVTHTIWGADWSYTWAFDRFDQVITTNPPTLAS